MNRQNELHVNEQLAASVVDFLNHERFLSYATSLGKQEAAFQSALLEVQSVRDFINNPSQILGSTVTKHGEVAEHLEVGMRRAFDALNCRSFSATFEGISRIASVDYRIDGDDVQSKFCNGARNTLDAVREHLEKYPDFGKNGEYYHVPKDLHAQMLEILEGKIPHGLSETSAHRLREKIEEMCQATGKPFEELVRSGSFDYAEVQLRAAPQTLDGVEEKVSAKNEALKEEIGQNHKPAIGEAMQGATIGAGLAAGLSLAHGLYKKHREGKPLLKLNTDDWKELGLDSAKSGVVGFASALAIYGLTNACDVSAPLAGVVVSSARGIFTQVSLYRHGDVSGEQLIENSIALSGEAGIVLACSVIGQGLIPVPILGSVLGTITGKFVAKVLLDTMGEAGKALAAEIDNRATVAFAELDEKYQKLLKTFTDEFDAMDNIIVASFDPENNARMIDLSIELATLSGVPEHEIIRNHAELDQFILN